uniref:helix-turn-helix domain-containing protein n=1 Tax=Eubacterium sp. TaxID=142586 RepID=UPI0040298F16
MFDEYPDILTVQDIMRALDIGRNKAYDLLRHKKIKNIKIGSNYRIPKKYLIEFVYTTVSV